MNSNQTYWAIMLGIFVSFLAGYDMLTDKDGMISLHMLWGGVAGSVIYAVLHGLIVRK